METSTEASVLEKVDATFKIEQGGTWEEWEVLEFRIKEVLGAPYFGDVVIASKSRPADFSKWAGKSCVLVLTRGKDQKRLFKGLAMGADRLEAGEGYRVARVELGAALLALLDGERTRVFENRTVPEIIEEVLKEGLQQHDRKVRMSLGRLFEPRESCVQWRESDMSFVQRLMAEEGIACFFDQGEHETNDKETVVVVDSNHAYVEVETMGGSEVA